MLEGVAREDLGTGSDVAKQEEFWPPVHHFRVNLVFHERHEHGQGHEPGDDLQRNQHGAP
jgi:hypothetical protein